MKKSQMSWLFGAVAVVLAAGYAGLTYADEPAIDVVETQAILEITAAAQTVEAPVLFTGEAGHPVDAIVIVDAETGTCHTTLPQGEEAVGKLAQVGAYLSNKKCDAVIWWSTLEAPWAKSDTEDISVSD